MLHYWTPLSQCLMKLLMMMQPVSGGRSWILGQVTSDPYKQGRVHSQTNPGNCTFILRYFLNESCPQAGPRGEREIQFYRTITEATDSSLKQFQPFIPSFYGSCTKKDGQFMMIENATMRMTRPCIMDIKVRKLLSK